MPVITVESRVVAYQDGVELPHVFTSVSSPVEVEQIDNSPHTIDRVVQEGIVANATQLHDSFESCMKGTPLDLGNVSPNSIDQNVLRNLVKALDEGKARILQSRFTRRDSTDPTWYCIQVKKL